MVAGEGWEQMKQKENLKRKEMGEKCSEFVEKMELMTMMKKKIEGERMWMWEGLMERKMASGQRKEGGLTQFGRFGKT